MLKAVAPVVFLNHLPDGRYRLALHVWPSLWVCGVLAEMAEETRTDGDGITNASMASQAAANCGTRQHPTTSFIMEQLQPVVD